MNNFSKIEKITISIITITFLTIGTGTVFAQDVDADDTIKELSDFQPGIMDKMKYEKFYDSPKPSKPIPESEIIDVPFSKEWLIKHDMDSNPSRIAITFPTIWLAKPSKLTTDDVIHLKIPTKMLNMLNSSKNPDQISISLNCRRFIGYTDSMVDVQLLPPLQQSQDTVEETKSIEYVAKRQWYVNKNINNSLIDVIAVEGTVIPAWIENNGETFTAYQEMEIITDVWGDLGEIISEYSTYRNRFYVWVAIYEDGTWDTSRNWLLIEADEGEQIEYMWWLFGGYYVVWLIDEDGNMYSNIYDHDDDPSEIKYLIGSSELYTEDGIFNDFLVASFISAEQVHGYFASATFSTDTETVFNYYGVTGSTAPYVDSVSYFSGSGNLWTILTAFDE